MALECLPTPIWCSLFVNKHWKSLLKHTYSLGRMTNLPCGSYPYPLFFLVKDYSEMNGSWPQIVHTHIYIAYNFGLFFFLLNPNCGSIPSHEFLLSCHHWHCHPGPQELVGAFQQLSAVRPEEADFRQANTMGKVRRWSFSALFWGHNGWGGEEVWNPLLTEPSAELINNATCRHPRRTLTKCM